MKAKLIGLDNQPSDAFQFEEFPVTVGRSIDLEWCLQDRWVSRRHCVLDIEGGQLVIKDLGSKHGTFVNGRRIDESPLVAGDKLSIGMCTFFVSIEAQTALEAPTRT